MISALTMIANLQDLVERHGNFNILLQGDEEGNRYDFARGVELTHVSEDREMTVDTTEEAEEYGEEFTPVFVIYP